MTQTNTTTPIDELRLEDAATRLAFLNEPLTIHHPRMMELEERLAAILNMPEPYEHSIAVFGRSFNGKSTISKHFASLHPIQTNILGDADRADVVRISMPGEASVREFAIRILRYVGEPFNLRWSTSHLTSMAYAVLRAMQTKLLIIDEFQDLANGTSRNREALKNMIKSIGEDTGCGVALFGTPAGIDILNDDPQLQRRFEQLVLPPWERGDEANVLIHNLEVRLPLRKVSHIVADPALVETILEMGDHVIGHIRRVMLLAARTAIQTGREVIDAKTLEAMEWVPLSERSEDVVNRLQLKADKEWEPA
ncbi:TniB family NTP-binding protein (plasmid) [Erythrobacteraceae bacterium WH01K]|nr:TniB family NTP-binding protein [Erythrobacteraceae bacterium WH01K]